LHAVSYVPTFAYLFFGDPMPEFVTCPNCKHDFQPNVQDGWVHCPECGNAVEARPDVPALPAEPDKPPFVEAAGDYRRVNDRPRVRRADRVYGQRERSDRRPRKSSLLGPLFVACCLLLAVLVGVVVIWESRKIKKVVPEDPRERAQQVKEAFRDAKPLDVGQLGAELGPLFAELGAAFHAADRERIVGCFDVSCDAVGTENGRRSFSALSSHHPAAYAARLAIAKSRGEPGDDTQAEGACVR
jgi:hypothetical protein